MGSSPLPVAFGGCFGWLHPGASSRGVVLCASHGAEAQAVHRIWRELAGELADAGMPTLRFDYRGTGDSLEEDDSPGRVDAWRDDVVAAVRWLRQTAGVSEIGLVGLRLGALLALAAAEALGGVDHLVLLAPPASGGAFARELEAAAQRTSPDGIEVDGFFYSRETLADLAALPMPATGRRPAITTLILQPADAPTTRLAPQLSALGVDTDEDTLLGYAELMGEAHYPRRAFDRAVFWLRHALPLKPSVIPESILADLASPAAIETPVRFGDPAALAGVMCQPRQKRAELPALVFLADDAARRIGRGRRWVALARHFAGLGIASLRVDLADTGDSAHDPTDTEGTATDAVPGSERRSTCSRGTEVGARS